MTLDDALARPDPRADPRRTRARITCRRRSSRSRDIPRTISGKITELAVRDVVHGRPVKNADALANPAGARAVSRSAGARDLTVASSGRGPPCREVLAAPRRTRAPERRAFRESRERCLASVYSRDAECRPRTGIAQAAIARPTTAAPTATPWRRLTSRQAPIQIPPVPPPTPPMIPPNSPPADPAKVVGTLGSSSFRREGTRSPCRLLRCRIAPARRTIARPWSPGQGCSIVAADDVDEQVDILGRHLAVDHDFIFEIGPVRRPSFDGSGSRSATTMGASGPEYPAGVRPCSSSA